MAPVTLAHIVPGCLKIMLTQSRLTAPSTLPAWAKLIAAPLCVAVSAAIQERVLPRLRFAEETRV